MRDNPGDAIDVSSEDEDRERRDATWVVRLFPGYTRL